VNERPSYLAIGFCGLAIASAVVAAQHLRWIPAAQGHAVALAVLATVVPLQAVGAGCALVAGDTVSATGAAVLSATWGADAAIALSLPAGATSDARGVALLAAACALAIPAVAGAVARLGPAMVIAAAATSFTAAGLYDLTAAAFPRVLSGVLGLLVSALALGWALALALGEARSPQRSDRSPASPRTATPVP